MENLERPILTHPWLSNPRTESDGINHAGFAFGKNVHYTVGYSNVCFIFFVFWTFRKSLALFMEKYKGYHAVAAKLYLSASPLGAD